MQNLVRQGADRASRALLEASRPLNEGTGLARPSEEPVQAARLMGLRDFGAQLDRFERNRTLIQTDLGIAEDVLAGIHDLVSTSEDVALAMSNDTVNASDRQAAARQIDVYLNQILGTVNRKDSAGKFLFAGTAEDKAPFAADGTYQGNEGARFVQVGAGLTVQATMSGTVALGDKNQVFQSMKNLRTALEKNDLQGIQDSIAALEEARQITLDARTEIGARLSTLNDVLDLNAGLRTHVDLERSSIESVDVAKVAPAMTSAQAALEATVSASKTLMDSLTKSLLS
ncbi:MAG: hypothetical protein U1F43_33845 [Myxococcota bacterium]